MKFQNKKNYIKKNCVVCGNEFYTRRVRTRKGRSPVGLRPVNSKTCSRECAWNFSDATFRKEYYRGLKNGGRS